MAIPIEADTEGTAKPEYSAHQEACEIADELDCLEARTIHEADLLFRAAAALRRGS